MWDEIYLQSVDYVGDLSVWGEGVSAPSHHDHGIEHRIVHHISINCMAIWP